MHIDVLHKNEMMNNNLFVCSLFVPGEYYTDSNGGISMGDESRRWSAFWAIYGI